MALHTGGQRVGEGDRYRRLLKIQRCGKGRANCESVRSWDIYSAFRFWLHGEAEIGDESDDGLLGYLVGIEANRDLALRIGRFARSNALLLAEHGIETGSAGDATESLDEIDHGLACSG